MELAVLLPLVAFAALAIAFATVLRRAGRLVARTRRLEGFRHDVRDLETRIGRSLDSAIERIDAVRRGQVDAGSIVETLAAVTDATARYEDEVRALHGPPDAIAIRDDIAAELGRAARAIGMVEHGVMILTAARRGAGEVEAQTSVKRGYLNLLHAREAIGRHAARAEGLDAVEPRGRVLKGRA